MGIGSYDGAAADTQRLRQPSFRRQTRFWGKFARANGLLECASEALIQRPLSLCPGTKELHNLMRIHNSPLSSRLDMGSQSILLYTDYSRSMRDPIEGAFRGV